MSKQILTKAHQALFERSVDERFTSLTSLATHCQERRGAASDRWFPPRDLKTFALGDDQFQLGVGSESVFSMNDWSFSQLCRLAGVGKETVNRLSAKTASDVFRETLPSGSKPLQLYVEGERIRSIHGTAYTRLYDAEVVHVLQEFAVDFQPPQEAKGGGTGLYAGEQDLFCFLIDPAGWTEIEGEAFAPGFFVWNSEVGRRSVGIQTFWFQAVCQNHLVFDAVEVIEFTRKHTASVKEGINEIRRIIERLVERRDERRDGFVQVIRKAMSEKLGDDAEETLKELLRNGIPRSAAKEALALAEKQGRFTIFSLVDALTQLATKVEYAGDRTELDVRASALLTLAV